MRRPSSDTNQQAAQESAPDGGGRPKSKPSKRAKPCWPPPPKERLDGALEALLLTVGDVVRMDRIRDLLGLPSRTVVEEALEMTGVILFIHAILAHMAGDRDKDVTEQVHIET